MFSSGCPAGPPESNAGGGFFGKSGELASSRRDQQELAVLSLHLRQAALVYVNTR
jgi:TnpA family transposase